MDLVISPSLHLERLVLSSFVGPHKAIIGSQTPSYLSSGPPHGWCITEASISAVSKLPVDSTLTLPELISLQVQGLLVFHTLGAMSHALMLSQLAKNRLIWSPHDSSLHADLLTPHFQVTQGISVWHPMWSRKVSALQISRQPLLGFLWPHPAGFPCSFTG